MDLRGKPSTFSAEGTEKLVVGEDGLDGGSLVVSMMAVDGGGGGGGGATACVRARLGACECVKRRLRGCMGEWRRGWRSGWPSESQMDYQLIRMNRRSGEVVEEAG